MIAFALLSAALALVPAMLCYRVRWRLDRGLAEPPWIFPALLVLGGAGGVLFSLYGYSESEDVLRVFIDPLPEPVFAGAVLDAAAEELGKAFILLLFVPSRWFRSTVDGVLYGFAAGIGFAVVENFLYFMVAYDAGGTVGWGVSVFTRLAPSTVIHGGATAIVGAFIGAALHERRSLIALAAPVLGFVVACLLHGSWNGLLRTARVEDEPLYETLAWLLLPLVAVTVGALFAVALRVESALVRLTLAEEVDAGRMTDEEVDAVSHRRREPTPDWLPPGADRARFVGAATALTYARTEREAERWRGVIERARGRPPA